MNLSISGGGACHGSVYAFLQAIRGPKIEHFRSRTYGSSIQMVAFELGLQNPQRTLRHRTRYFKESRCLYYHIVLADELELGDERCVLEAIVATLQKVLRKSFRKIKGEDFDSSRFEAELIEFLRERIGRRTAQNHVA